MEHKLNRIFKIISFYDDFRWKDKSNYNIINFFDKQIDDDSKLLTHWFCYIADRQMAFKTIWDVGGFVFSELIYEMKRHKNLNLLDPMNTESFIKKDSTDNKYLFISKTNANSLISQEYENYIENEKVKFKSRFLPADYFCMLYTFIILEDYHFDFTKFLSEIYNKNKHNQDYIGRILFSLYLLTYHDVGQPNSDNVGNFDENYKAALNRKNDVYEILNNEEIFELKYSEFCCNKKFKQKRAWCSLRDFIKSPEFKTYFINSLKRHKFLDEDINKLISENSFEQLELPGDVWNNNSKFRNCILQDTEYENSKKVDLNVILRKHFEKYKPNIIGYPEQFDITFNFVPNMCEKNNCNICPINRLDNDNNFDKICVKNENMYCPVVLVGCNFKNECIGINKCKIL